MADGGQKSYKIGEVAKELEIAVETIRMYETAGLFIAEKTTSGQRIFNQSDLNWLNCIRRLIKEQGLNLEGIRQLLALMPCWEIKPCATRERNRCPAYLGANKPCWTMKSMLPKICREANCRECAVYLRASECTNLKALLYRAKAGGGAKAGASKSKK